VRVLRVIEYVGPRSWIDRTLASRGSLPDRETLQISPNTSLRAVVLTDEQAAIVAPWIAE